MRSLCKCAQRATRRGFLHTEPHPGGIRTRSDTKRRPAGFDAEGAAQRISPSPMKAPASVHNASFAGAFLILISIGTALNGPYGRERRHIDVDATWGGQDNA